MPASTTVAIIHALVFMIQLLSLVSLSTGLAQPAGTASRRRPSGRDYVNAPPIRVRDGEKDEFAGRVGKEENAQLFENAADAQEKTRGDAPPLNRARHVRRAPIDLAHGSAVDRQIDARRSTTHTVTPTSRRPREQHAASIHHASERTTQ